MIAARTLALAAMMVFAGALNAEAGSLSGIVVDDTGAPLGGMHVVIVDQANDAKTVRDSTVTDGDGRYVITTDTLPPGQYRAEAFQEVSEDGQAWVVPLTPNDNSAFAGSADTIRNFAFVPTKSDGQQP
jgi:hypothetical protein